MKSKITGLLFLSFTMAIHAASSNTFAVIPFPRACALVEVNRSAKDSRNWDGFMRRLQIQAQRFNQLNSNYRHAAVETPEPDLLK